MSELTIPALSEGCTVLQAAFAYADAGWYVLPVEAGSKHPGSVVGKGWHEKSSRDPQQIASWFTGQDYSIALHVGRSGAFVVDVDRPESVPAELCEAIDASQAPYQSTRVSEPHRGHYVFRMPAGRTVGNSTAGLGGEWGDIRGANGVIIVEPSKHPAADGQYRWERTGTVPECPSFIADRLNDAGSAVEPATPARVTEFVEQYDGTADPALLDLIVSKYAERVERGESRHESATWAMSWAMKAAKLGKLPARHAVKRLGEAFEASIRGERDWKTEFDKITEWAIGCADAEPEPPTPVEASPEKAFWEATPILAAIRQWADSQLIPPWTLLGAVLARVAAHVHPRVGLPAIIGARGSLNLMVALVGGSGTGKDTSLAVADECLKVQGFDVPEVRTHNLGSGEGVAAAYVHRPTSGPEKGKLVQHAESAIFTAMEIEKVDKLAERNGATLASVLREAWSGSALGSQNVSAERRLHVPAHSYRWVLVMGVQPGKAGGLLDGEDAGTPQRILWMPTGSPDLDPDASRPSPIEWEPVTWADTTNTPAEIGVIDAVRQEIRQARIETLRTGASDEYAHTRLTRLKVAALLAILHGEHRVTEQWWALSGVIADVSDRTRESLKAHREKVAREREKALGERMAVREQAADAHRLRGLEEWVLKRVTDWTSSSELRRKLDSKRRPDLPAALESLQSRGLIVSREAEYRGQTGHEYRRADS